MIRIGLSGTNWTRKSTTISRVVQALRPRKAEVIALSPLVAACPFPMGPGQTLDGSGWMVSRLTELLASEPNEGIEIFDRTPLDVLAFTLYAADRGQNRDSAMAVQLFDQIRKLGGAFDRIFICRPSAEWPSPVEPPESDLAFASQIDRYLTEAAAAWPDNLVELPWPSTERLATVLRLLDSAEV